ncbi:hypothetical protein [Azospirillum isscasi]|uniref:Uncharacterized protein n=1 Tax=Azospirillum isscasi TaxID=3053926 RepID=A0ABU0WP29_9PROT|nr:hypothetical protein [Azospirillum isscasi]MDQ2105993.1 hypothetical protein [Azospirillum isscasi]
MKFTDQINLSGYLKNIGIKGSPSAALYREKLYVIYNGAGNDGLYFLTYDGKDWSGPTRLEGIVGNVGVAENSSPSAIVARDLLYVFYNGAGNDGTYYITYDGNEVKGPVSIKGLIGGMGFQKSTSPSATVYGDPYLFWVGSGDDGIYYSILDHNTWTGGTRVNAYASGVGIAGGTSPFAIEYMADFYLFYNGRGNDGTFYTVLTNQGWQPPVGIKGQIGEMGFRGNTSPTACLSGGTYQLLVFYAGSGQDGIYVTSYDGVGSKAWAKQVHVTCPNGVPGILDGTSPCAVTYKQTPYLFWNGSGNDGIYMTTVEV